MADPYTTPIPGAASYETATLAAKTAYSSALTRLNQQRGDTLRQYGYSSQIDPTTGVVNNVAVDANLPYGQYQQERKSHADQYQATKDAAQARGLGHGGLAAAAVTNLRGGFGAEDAALGGGLTSQLGNFQDQQNQAAYARDATLGDVERQKAQDAIDQQNFNTAQQNAKDMVPYDQTDWGTIITHLLSGDGSGNDATNTDPPAPVDWSSAVASLTAKPKSAPKHIPANPTQRPVSKAPSQAAINKRAVQQAPAKKKKK